MAKTLDLRHLLRACPECGQRYSADARFCPFDGSGLEVQEWDPANDTLVGQIIDDRYRVLAAIGEGGMGTVYKVRHTTLERAFAMKVLRRDMAREDLAERFTREAKAAASVHHPGVVEITDFGRLPDKRPYFVMELLEGSSLISILHGRRALEPALACSIAAKIARAVGAAHSMGIVHRDLKPENVFIHETRAGVDVKVVDFGAAMVIGASRITKSGIVYGTPHYMSPEQAGGHPLDHRADIYSLGVLFFEMLVGAVPFEADTYMEVLRKQMVAPPPPPSELMTSGSPAIDEVILRALEKNADDRYLTMESFADAIERASKSLSTSEKFRAPQETSSTSALRTALPVRSRTWTIGGVAVLGAVIVVAIAHATNGGSHSAAATPSPITPSIAPSTNAGDTIAPEKSPLPPPPLPEISSSAPPPMASITPASITAQPAPHLRDPAASSTATSSKGTTAPGDFPDPWRK